MLKTFRADIDQLQSKANQLTCGESEDAYYCFLSRIMPKVVECEACSFFIHDPVSGELWIKSGLGVTEKQIIVPTEESVVGRVINGRAPIIDNEMQSRDGIHKKTDAQTNFVTRSVLCYPIMSPDGSTVTGAVQFLNKTNGGFGDADLETAKQLAQMMALNVEQTFLSQSVFALTNKLLNTASQLFTWVLGLAVMLGILLMLYMGGMMLAPSLLN